MTVLTEEHSWRKILKDYQMSVFFGHSFILTEDNSNELLDNTNSLIAMVRITIHSLIQKRMNSFSKYRVSICYSQMLSQTQECSNELNQNPALRELLFMVIYT